MSLRKLIAAVRRFILKETTAERLKRDRDYVERKLTVAQEKAARAFSKGKTEVTKIAEQELKQLQLLIHNAATRVAKLTETETLPDVKQTLAVSVADHLKDTPKPE